MLNRVGSWPLFSKNPVWQIISELSELVVVRMFPSLFKDYILETAKAP